MTTWTRRNALDNWHADAGSGQTRCESVNDRVTHPERTDADPKLGGFCTFCTRAVLADLRCQIAATEAGEAESRRIVAELTQERDAVGRELAQAESDLADWEASSRYHNGPRDPEPTG